MAVITTRFGEGGANMAPGGAAGLPDLATVLRDVADDLAALRTSIVGIAGKLDADATVTDTNYAALHTPAAMKTVKG
ncbi:MAG: hypothetical protein HOW73_43180 [Polyangiaceae bacterium]|nr:hypothetical protein [Polyangiaceae bacterium]